MSAYTTIHFVNVRDPLWLPHPSMLNSLLGLFEATAMAVIGYGKPLLWDDPKRSVVFDEDNYPSQSVVSLYETKFQNISTRLYTMRLVIPFTNWCQQQLKAFSTIPADISDDFVPCDASITLGYHSIPSLDFDETQGFFAFGLSLSNHGLPADTDRYMAYLQQSQPLHEIQQALFAITGQQFEALLSSSY